MKILTFILTLTFFSCGNKPSDNKNIDQPQTENQTDINNDTTREQKRAELKKSQPTEFIVKDETKYSQIFLKEFKERHSVYETVSLIDDTIIVNNDRVGQIIIPTDLPLNQQVTYTKTENSKKQVLTVKRINYSTLEYSYYEVSNERKTNERQGTADLEPVFYFGAEGTFEDENENIYGMNEYIDNSEKDCWTYIYVGVGSIEKSFLTHGCETDRNKFKTPLLTRTK
ncbi:MAG: hypothetical protein IPL48_04010 [Bacteroidetes bacterium]|nr:hypothetical protein [Bacteroidota bacterium]